MSTPVAPVPLKAPDTASPISTPDERFDTPAVVTVAASHFVHDLYPSFIGPILPYLIEKHGMTMAIAGGLATVLRWPSVAQPFLGYLADRYDARLLVVLPPMITALAIGLLGPAPGYPALVALLLIAGASSAAFHPTGAAMVTRLSGRSWGRGTSYFMTGGELSRAVGPIYIVSIVAAFGFDNMWLAAIPGIFIALLTYTQLRRLNVHVAGRAAPQGLRSAFADRGGPILLLAGVVTFRSLVIASFQTFFPTYLTGAGATLVFAGMALAVYEAGGVTGAFLGGPISDRFGRRQMMAISQAVAGPVLWGSLLLWQQPIGLVLLALGGLLAISAGPVQLALAQELLPRNRSLASGIMMFLSFEGQVFATIGIGLVADAVGLQTALGWSILASMLSLPFTLLLPETRRAATA